MYNNISYPNFNNNSFCYNNQVMQKYNHTNKNNCQSFGENLSNNCQTAQNPSPKTVYVPTQVPNGNGSGVNIIIYNPAVVPGNNTTFNNHYAQSPTLNSTPTNDSQNSQQMPKIEDENLNNQDFYNNFAENKNINTQEDKIQEEPLENIIPEENQVKNDVKQEEKNVETKEVTLLTDEFVKTLENYLRNDNKDVRIQGMEMLAKCFREDKNRKDDVALTNLLNLALQDVDPRIRLLAMSLIKTKDANGDYLTLDILTQLQASTTYGGEEAKMASSVLLEMNTKKVEVPQAPEVPQTSEIPQAPEVQQTSEIPQTPEIQQPLIVPQASEVSQNEVSYNV